MRALYFFLGWATACAAEAPADGDRSQTCPAPDTDGEGTLDPVARVVTDVRVPGHTGLVQVRVEAGQVTELGESVRLDDAQVTDGGGRWLTPGWIDSHVHLAYLPAATEMAGAGVVAVVDLAAPIDWLAHPPTALRMKASGPMVTPPGGYPTQSWGRNGYGLEVATAEAAEAAVDQLYDAGARVIKVPLNGPPDHSDTTLQAIVARAHSLELPVVVHALDSSGAQRAAEAGADVLVHVPTDSLSDAAVRAWAGRAVVPTLAAFGASDVAIDNLRRLHGAGATILYGTDFGNARTVGISTPELEAMAAAGMSPAEVWAAGTSVPASFWGWDDLGTVAVGAHGVFVLTDVDPALDLSTWAREVVRWPGQGCG